MQNSPDPIEFQVQALKQVASIYRAINHALRQKIILFLNEKGQAAVTEIHETFQLDQSSTSQHLGILRKAGIVITQRDGKKILYAVNHERIEQIQQATREILHLNKI